MSVAVGIIGTGVMGAEHARILREETRDADVVAVCDADEGRARAVAHGAAVFTDPLALIGSDGVQAVIVASPDDTHAALAIACLKAGKPVLCEKPLAATSTEALKVVEAEVAIGRRLVQVGYMRRFDPAYLEMKRFSEAGGIGTPVLLHNVHRNVAAPSWFTGPMAVTNSFVHEIDISRWLLDAEMVSAQVHAGRAGEPLMITMETDRGEIVSTEVFVNAAYGYNVRAELVGRNGSVELAAPTLTLVNRAGWHGHDYPDNWVPRFREAYRLQMNAWVEAVTSGAPIGASAWDGYVTTAIAEQVVGTLATGERTRIALGDRPGLYS
jgi:myo-inositol 2-dehydrogenase/D-chiro-inositol 1-dehydrogenase